MTRRTDPGRDARAAVIRPSSGGENGRPSALKGVELRFMAREVVIECHHADCPGKLFTDLREIIRPEGASSRVHLKCTREPREHDVVILVRPHTTEEVERLQAARIRGEGIPCARCETPLDLVSGTEPESVGSQADEPAVYQCSWCGLVWGPKPGARSQLDEPGSRSQLAEPRRVTQSLDWQDWLAQAGGQDES